MWKKDTIAVVVVAGITTGLVSGIPFNKVVEILGTHRWILWNSFNSNVSQF
ncbi:hypothetical protein [Clostridium sp. FP1]|uniref:hypothetical protein n=1 Tax=Clostridium sp. FP1 TaxID=2724076 RepID=UPI0021E401BC|nr:hypothetical protein [Clostridium sp. FP1]